MSVRRITVTIWKFVCLGEGGRIFSHILTCDKKLVVAGDIKRTGFLEVSN